MRKRIFVTEIGSSAVCDSTVVSTTSSECEPSSAWVQIMCSQHMLNFDDVVVESAAVMVTLYEATSTAKQRPNEDGEEDEGRRQDEEDTRRRRKRRNSQRWLMRPCTRSHRDQHRWKRDKRQQ